MRRPRTFDEIRGHDWLVSYFKEHLKASTLPHFLIIEGAEGLGKTSIADLLALSLVYGDDNSAERTNAYNTVVTNKVSNEYIRKYEMSVEGGKEVAKEVRADMQAAFTGTRNKVIICDECHNLSDAAQDVFLAETEYIDKRVYIIMLTTEIDRLKPSLRSRSVPIHMNTLKQSDMVEVLRAEAIGRQLNVQNMDITLGMIAEWAEGKPRTGLNILNAFTTGSSVSTNAIRELIGYLDIRDVVPLLSALSGSMTFGLTYISEMKVDSSIVNLVVEALRIKSGEGSYKIKLNDVQYVREQLTNVTAQQLVTFLYGLTRHTRLSRVDIINAFISAHSQFSMLSQPSTKEALDIEKAQKAEVVVDSQIVHTAGAPTLEDLLLGADIIDN